MYVRLHACECVYVCAIYLDECRYYKEGKKIYLEIDIWMPDLNLGFEYQVLHGWLVASCLVAWLAAWLVGWLVDWLLVGSACH